MYNKIFNSYLTVIQSKILKLILTAVLNTFLKKELCKKFDSIAEKRT